jgi:ubiquinone/menaquinone biosynthesis C-methylase UbiE
MERVTVRRHVPTVVARLGAVLRRVAAVRAEHAARRAPVVRAVRVVRARVADLGAGTGYFTLNLLQAGVIDQATATDISRGMLDRLAQTAVQLDVEVDTVRCDAERLPFDDETYDIVFGHAVLHHIPHLKAAMSEFNRVLAPGGELWTVFNRHLAYLPALERYVGPTVVEGRNPKFTVTRSSRRPL